MTRIKICGITNKEDAKEAVSLGVNALGFVFAQSPRRVEAELAAQIIEGLPPFVATVGVFVNEEAKKVERALDVCRLDFLQFHGEESSEYCRSFKDRKRLIKAFRIKGRDSLASLRQYQVDAYLLDAYVEGLPGGTGSVFNWELAEEAARLVKPIILSGGLSPDNIGEAILKVKPYAVDVSSGVEAEPGKKDFKLMKRFVEAVTSADKST